MKIFVLGAGMMGRAVVHDLAGAREVRQIVVGDFDRGRAAEVAKKFGRGRAQAVFAGCAGNRRVGEACAWLRCGSELYAV